VDTVEQARLKFPSTGNAVDFGQVPHVVTRLAIATLSCLCEKPLRGKNSCEKTKKKIVVECGGSEIRGRKKSGVTNKSLPIDESLASEKL